MNATAALVDRLFTLPSLPPAVVVRTKELILDCLSTVVIGSQTDEGIRIRKYVRKYGRDGNVTVVMEASGREPAMAALANGTSGYSVGLTDTHNLSVTHPGASVIPAALAIGQAVGASGKQVLEAVVRGYETVTRIGSAVSPSHRQRGFHVTGTVNVFGAAVAAGYILGLNRSQLLSALGIAGSQASGLFEFRANGAMTMAFHAGRAAQSGIMAALLAEDGYTGPETILEGADGFCRAYADNVDLSVITNGIGERYELMEVGIRPYCACRYAHSAIDALEHIRKERGGLDPNEIEELVVETHQIAVIQEAEPDTLVGARLSTAFNVALAIIDGPRLTGISLEDLQRHDVKSLASRIEVVEAPDLTALYPKVWASRVHLKMVGGESITARVDLPKGDPQNPLTTAEVEEKFRNLCMGRVAEDAVNRVVQAVLIFESLPKIDVVMEPLRVLTI